MGGFVSRSERRTGGTVSCLAQMPRLHEHRKRIFDACDTNSAGELNPFEFKFALHAAGIFPTQQQLIAALDDHQPINFASYCSAIHAFQAGSIYGACQRGRERIPYALRGIALKQLQSLNNVFIVGGWLRTQCDVFNARGSKRPLGENLYALNRFVIKPATSEDPATRNACPENLLKAVGVPLQLQESQSYSELVNANGVEIHFFVSHFWGHLFCRTLAALELYVRRVCTSDASVGLAPEDVIFWVCLFALNQHNPAEEVGSSPEEGPFNSALSKASMGAVMVLDENVEPFRRIWCLYEVFRLGTLHRPLTLITENGAIALEEGEACTSSLQEDMERIEATLLKLSARDATASVEDDRMAILYRIIVHWVREQNTLEQFKHALMTGTSHYWDEMSFQDFHVSFTSLIATPLLRVYLNKRDSTSALRCIGLGARCGRAEMESLGCLNVDASSAQAPTRFIAFDNPYSSPDTLVNRPLVQVLAMFGNVEALEWLLDHGANIDEKDDEGLTPLSAAAHFGQLETASLLVERGASLAGSGHWQKTATHFAAEAGYADIVKMLLDQRANLNARDEDGNESPFDIALKAGHQSLAEMLRDRGAETCGRGF